MNARCVRVHVTTATAHMLRHLRGLRASFTRTERPVAIHFHYTHVRAFVCVLACERARSARAHAFNYIFASGTGGEGKNERRERGGGWSRAQERAEILRIVG